MKFAIRIQWKTKNELIQSFLPRALVYCIYFLYHFNYNNLRHKVSGQWLSYKTIKLGSIFFLILKIYFGTMKNLYKASFYFTIHCVPVVTGLGQIYAFNNKSTIFTRSLRNFDKRRYS